MTDQGPVATERYASVWDALEATPGAAENMRVRSALMQELVAYIAASGMTQVQAAQRFGVTQPRISDLKAREGRPVQHRHLGQHAHRSRAPPRRPSARSQLTRGTLTDGALAEAVTRVGSSLQNVPSGAARRRAT